VYLFPERDDCVRFAALDIDNYGGEFEWSGLKARARPLYDQLRLNGMFQPYGLAAVRDPLRVFFAQPEQAAKVRRFLAAVLNAA
jgi:hypothetical protein